MFLLLVLVHLRFFHSVSCGWLPFWGSPAGYSFPNGRPYGKRSSSSSRPGGRRCFIGVRGVGSFFRAFGFPEVGAVSFPDPFRRLSVPPLAGLEGQGCGDLGCRGAAAGLLSALPQHSSSSIVPIPMPSSNPISITGAALEEVTLGLLAKGALELAPLPSPGFYSHLFVVRKTLGSWRPVIALSHLNRFVDVSHFQMETIQSVLLSVRQGDWMASIDLKEAYLQVLVHSASRHFLRFIFRGTVYQFKALCFGLSTAPQVFTRVMAPVSAILHSLGIRMRRYLADWLVQSSSRESLLEGLQTVLQLCQELGIVINPQKSNLIPSQVVQYLGVVIDSTSFRASPSVERISRLHSTAAEFRSCASPTVSLWLSLLGVSFFAGSPRSWRQTVVAVPPALPPSFLEPSGSGGSSVGVDGVSSRSPVVAPSPSSISRSVSPRGVSRPTLLVRRLGREMGCPSRLSGRFWPVGHPPDSVVYQRQGTARCSAGAFPVPVSSPRSHGGCLLRQHHSSGLPSQGRWHQVSSPQHLGSGDVALDGVPLHTPGSTVPSGLQQRPSRRTVSPSPAPTYRVVSKRDRLSIFGKTLAGPNSFICHLRQSSLFDLLLTFPGSDVGGHGHVSPVLGGSSGLRFPSGGYHSTCSRDAPGLHGDGAHPSGSTLGPVPLVLGHAPAFAGSSSGPPGPS